MFERFLKAQRLLLTGTMCTVRCQRKNKVKWDKVDKKQMYTTTCTRLFKSNGIYFSNAYLIYQSSIFWSKLLTWHFTGILWGWCEILYAYDYSSRLYDHSKSVSFEKRDIKTFATGTDFGGCFIMRDRLLWELKLFLFHGIEMKLVHKITVCVSGLEIKLTLS